VMDALHAWFEAQFVEKTVEPNSGLGEAITYCLKRWDRLTLFLRQAGAPLDSNLVERALKKCILHRKNSLFYKTEKGAEVGDLFMSLIHTCELNHVNPFEHLTELQKHAQELAENPAAWMPWNYRQALKQAGGSEGSASALPEVECLPPGRKRSISVLRGRASPIAEDTIQPRPNRFRGFGQGQPKNTGDATAFWVALRTWAGAMMEENLPLQQTEVREQLSRQLADS